MGSIPRLTLACTKVPLKICWSVSCDTWQLPDCTWLVFFPNLHWTLAHSRFRLPKSSCFSYGSSRNPRSTSAVASVPSSPRKQDRVKLLMWNSASVKAVICCCLLTSVPIYVSGYWCLDRNDHNAYQRDDNRHRCWLSEKNEVALLRLSLHQAFCHDTGWHPCSQSVHTLWFRLPGGENEQEREINVSPVWALQCSGLVPFISSACCDLYCHFCVWWL